MTSFNIETPKDFFDHIVTPDATEFLATEPNLRAAYHACNSLLSYRDWVFTAHKGETWLAGGAVQSAISGKKQFQTALEAIEAAFSIVTDISNASKHMVLTDGLKRTELYGNANTAVSETGGGFSAGAFGEDAFATITRSITVKIGEAFFDVRECVSKVHESWVKLNTENSW
jgi:hypothetical protein